MGADNGTCMTYLRIYVGIVIFTNQELILLNRVIVHLYVLEKQILVHGTIVSGIVSATHTPKCCE